MSLAITLAEKGLLPDSAIRTGIRTLLRERLADLSREKKTTDQWVQELESRPLAEDTDAANDQHYEIPANYFTTVLGKHLKYSSGIWPQDCQSLEASESAMLDLSCQRAELADGQQILELGCGWGSLSLWIAEHFPGSQITSISNSNSQREYIEGQCKARGLTNLKVITCDINHFAPEGIYDRIVSVEMFEHVRNHRQLLRKIDSWLAPGGKLFVHIFAHREEAYLFDVKSSKDWMSKYFFTGGIMPSADLLPTAAESLTEEERWEVNGTHYSKTLEAWLDKQDANKDAVMAEFKKCYGPSKAKLWFQRWRIFYMACSELFGYNDGNEWLVMHYRFAKP
ncbi:MAG: cyclopropane-fatty-acyl-phospholipid synthase family protein [Verrucomicrobiota bacterium]